LQGLPSHLKSAAVFTLSKRGSSANDRQTKTRHFCAAVFAAKKTCMRFPDFAYTSSAALWFALTLKNAALLIERGTLFYPHTQKRGTLRGTSIARRGCTQERGKSGAVNISGRGRKRGRIERHGSHERGSLD